jgi:hypothetical protein
LKRKIVKKAMKPLKLILGLLLALSLPCSAQTSASPVTVSGPPDVLVIVYQQPGGADQVDITYAGTVPHAQAVRDYQALTRAAGWPVSTHRIKDAAAPMQSRSGPMTSIVFQALGVVQDSTHTFPIETFARAFHLYKRINVVFFVGPQFQFQGARSYADPNIRMTLDQRSTSYVYQIEILHPNFGSLPLSPAPANTQTGAGNGSRGLVVLCYILGVALLAGLLVYWLASLYWFASRMTPKEKQKWNPEARPEDDTEGKAESQQEVSAKK